MKFLSVSILLAQDTAIAPAASAQKNVRWAGIVLPGRQPQSGWFAQGGGISLFKTQISDSTLRTSNVYLFGFYSQFQQWRLSIGGDIFTQKEKYYINSWQYMSYIPEQFFGLGLQTRFDQFEYITYYLLYSHIKVFRQVCKKFFLGIGHHFEKAYHILRPDSGFYARQVTTYAEGYHVQGVAPKLRYDSRDNIYSTRRGVYAEAYYYHYVGFAARTESFGQLILDFRKFILLLTDKNLVWAIRARHFQNIFGSAPFRLMPFLDVRGYHSNLFRSTSVSEFQTEWRMQLWRFLGFSIFGGLNQIGNWRERNTETSLKWNFGGGLRLRLIKKDNLFMRMEYAVGAEGNYAWYVSFADAF